jgi:hypothetical protein
LPRFDLKSYARRGAEVRLGELREEMNEIRFAVRIAVAGIPS